MPTITPDASDALAVTDTATVEVVRYRAYYGSVEGADRYFSEKLHGELWGVTALDRRLKALTTASQAIDSLRFAGTKALPGQPMEFPRLGSDTVPDGVQKATYEEALSLLRGVEPDTEYGGLFVKSRAFGKIGTDYDVSSAPEHLVAGIGSRRAWLLLKPFVARSLCVTLRRAS